MKRINWNPEKNREIIENRGISFEDIVFCLRSGGLLDDMAHANTVKYSHQVSIQVYLPTSGLAA